MQQTESHTTNLITGAYTDIKALHAWRYPAQRLALTPLKKTAGLVGGWRSPYRGQGMEFEESRAYQPGDDIRAIDWRVTARTGKAHTKLYREERERPVLLVVDQRQSLFFGSTHCMKSVTAAHIAAIFAWVAFTHNEKIGAIIFNDNDTCELRPKNGRRYIAHLLEKINTFNHQLNRNNKAQESALEENLKRASHVALPGTTVYIVSDFFGYNEQCQKYIQKIAKHCQVVCLDVYDEFEKSIPSGAFRFNDGEKDFVIDGNKKNQLSWKNRFQQQYKTLNQHLTQLRIPHTQIATQAPLFDLLITETRARR